MEVIVRAGQTLMDIAVQVYGHWEGVMLIAAANSISVSDVPEVGKRLQIPPAVYHIPTRDYLVAREISPATAITPIVPARIFSFHFSDEFA